MMLCTWARHFTLISSGVIIQIIINVIYIALFKVLKVALQSFNVPVLTVSRSG